MLATPETELMTSTPNIWPFQQKPVTVSFLSKFSLCSEKEEGTTKENCITIYKLCGY